MKYRFPKIDLHLHLDGSFRTGTLMRLAAARGVALPGNSEEEYDAFNLKCSNARDVNNFLEMFKYPLLVMQDKESLAVITYELIEDLHSQGLAYAEIRFAPQLHTHGGLTQDEAVEGVLEGRAKAAEDFPDIRTGIITCMMSVGPETVNWSENAETVEVCRRFMGKGVVALDLAGGEGFVPLSNFAPLFRKAAGYGIPVICHAGDSQDWHTVEDAIAFGAVRIGHGHHIYENPELCRLAAEKSIALEICPTSNVQCKTRASYAAHPASNLLRMGIPVTINTDNMNLSRVTLDDEYDHCLKEMGFKEKDLVRMNLNSLDACFLNPAEKEPIRRKLMEFLNNN